MAMFENETDQLITIVRRTTILDAKAIRLRAIFESRIPSNIKVFFRAEVEHYLGAERRTESRTSRFNYDMPEIQLLREQTDALLVHNFVFSRSDFEATLDKCVHFLFNYLCRPQWTLGGFLFEESSKVSAVQISKKLRYLRDYTYFPNILQRYLQQRNIGELTLEEGKGLLARIDDEVLRNHSSAEIAEMTQPFFDFVAYARSTDEVTRTKTLPVRALMYFFEDKKMSAILERLSQERELRHAKEISIHRLANVIERVRTGNEAAALFEEEPESDAVVESSSHASLTAVPEAGPNVEVPRPLPPLFTIEEERSIIKNVFHHNEEQFRAAVKEALDAESWDDAAHTIDHYFLMNDVEPFTKEAILFTNRLQSRFTDQAGAS